MTDTLLSYDRKLKNSVTKSLKDILLREGFIVNWNINAKHQLQLVDKKIFSAEYNHKNRYHSLKEKNQQFLKTDSLKHLKNIKCSDGENYKINLYEPKHNQRMYALMKTALTVNFLDNDC